MQKKFLKEAVSFVVGKQAEEIAFLLDSKKHVNEFIIAKKLDITINQTRNLLYKVADHGLVSSIRKKDKKKGWYTYFWKIEVLKSLEFLKGVFLKRAGQLINQIKSRETKQFYFCERCHIEFAEENALAYNFTCPECGNIFVLKDNSKLIKEFKRNLGRIEKDLDYIGNEIKIEKIKLDKKLTLEIKKKAKERKEKIAAKRKLTKMKKELELKKSIREAKKKEKKKIKKGKRLAKKIKKTFKGKKKLHKKKMVKKKPIKKKVPKSKAVKKIKKKQSKRR